MRRLRLLIDANVLVDAQSRDLFLRAAEAGHVEVYWSERILEETSRALGRMLPAGTDPQRLIAALRSAFPGASVAGYEDIEKSISLPDKDDRHVLAAAVLAECDVIATSNLKDFPPTVCDAYDVVAVNVDDALLLVMEQVGPDITDLVHRQIAAMRRPSTTPQAFIERLSVRAPRAAVMIGSLLQLPEQQRMQAEISRADSPESPQEAVRLLIDALREGDARSIAALVDPVFQRQLAPPEGRSRRLTKELRNRLGDVLTGTGWGFATAWRPQSPDVELVKLVQAGDDMRIVREPQEHPGHLFYLRNDGGLWRLIGLDGPDPGREVLSPPNEAPRS